MDGGDNAAQLQLDTAQTPRLLHHVSRADVQCLGTAVQPLATDRVVVPARNEAETIRHVLAYLLSSGFNPKQITVLVNNSSDDTEVVARKQPDVRVVTQHEAFTSHGVYAMRERYALPRVIAGKGAALLAALLDLRDRRDPADNARVFFVDADIKNGALVDPIGRLLTGWNEAPNARMIKLASQSRNNEGIHAYLGIPHNPFAPLGCLQWPLCGQMSIRWGDAKRMHLTTGYSVEVAMMLDLLAEYGSRDQSHPVFAEVELDTPLCDKPNSDQTHVLMYRNIMALLHALWGHNVTATRGLNASSIHSLNSRMGAANSTPFWVPSQPGSGPNTKELPRLDLFLPSVAECS